MLSEQTQKEIRDLLTRYPRKEASVIPALHAVQKQFGYVPDTAVAELADMLGLQPTRIADVLSFYTMFKPQKQGRYHIQVCRTLSCHSRGAKEMISYLEQQCGVPSNNGLSADGLFSIETVECLGACANAPVIQVNDVYYENLTREKIDEMIRKWKSE